MSDPTRSPLAAFGLELERTPTTIGAAFEVLEHGERIGSAGRDADGLPWVHLVRSARGRLPAAALRELRRAVVR